MGRRKGVEAPADVYEIGLCLLAKAQVNAYEAGFVYRQSPEEVT